MRVRAARAPRLEPNPVARRTGLGLATLQRIERDEALRKGKVSTVIKIQKALKQAGIHSTKSDSRDDSLILGVKAAAHHFRSCPPIRRCAATASAAAAGARHSVRSVLAKVTLLRNVSSAEISRQCSVLT
jgi:hypothetical protein